MLRQEIVALQRRSFQSMGDLLIRAMYDGNALCVGKMTVNTRFGTKVAVLAGDFLFAQSSWFLANLDNLEVHNLPSLCEHMPVKLYMAHLCIRVL